MDGAVSERRRPGGSGHDVSDRRDSSLIAGMKKTSAGCDVFFYLTKLQASSRRLELRSERAAGEKAPWTAPSASEGVPKGADTMSATAGIQVSLPVLKRRQPIMTSFFIYPNITSPFTRSCLRAGSCCMICGSSRPLLYVPPQSFQYPPYPQSCGLF